jgi:hypothetical protein
MSALCKLNDYIVEFFMANVHACIVVSARMLHFWRISMDKNTQTELEAAVFRRLVSHLQQHTDVQNIDLMILADFCRNCLAKWYTAAAIEQGIAMDYEQAREMVYGMPYNEWKDKFQNEATLEQLAAYDQKQQAKKFTLNDK